LAPGVENIRVGVLPPYKLTNDEVEELDTASTLPFQNTDDDGGGGNNWRTTTLINMIKTSICSLSVLDTRSDSESEYVC